MAYSKTIIQEVEADRLDYNIKMNIEYGHTLLAVVPIAFMPDPHYEPLIGPIIASRYKLIMLDVRG
jgi:hypothetical protein